MIRICTCAENNPCPWHRESVSYPFVFAPQPRTDWDWKIEFLKLRPPEPGRTEVQ